MPIEATGYVAPDISTIRSEFRTRFEALVDFTPAWDVDDVLTVLSEVCISLVMDNLEAVQNIYDAFSPTNATGRALENLAAMALVTRRPATFSRVEASFTGTPGTFLPAGRVVVNTATGSRWRTTEDITIPDTSILEAEESGPVPADIGTLTRIATPVSGWTGVTNAAQASLGRFQERDDQLRLRRLAALGGANTGTAAAMQKAIEDLDWVVGVRVLENSTSSSTTIGAFTLLPHSVLVLVLPNLLTAAEEAELGGIILEKLAAGIATNGGETVTVLDERDVSYDLKYDFATEVPVTVDYTVELAPGYALGDIEDAAEEAILAYFATIRIGGGVRLLPLVAAFDDIEGVLSVSIDLNGSPTDFLVSETEIATPGAISGTAL